MTVTATKIPHPNHAGTVQAYISENFVKVTDCDESFHQNSLYYRKDVYKTLTKTDLLFDFIIVYYNEDGAYNVEIEEHQRHSKHRYNLTDHTFITERLAALERKREARRKKYKPKGYPHVHWWSSVARGPEDGRHKNKGRPKANISDVFEE